MSQWVYGSYKAELFLDPCEGDMPEYAGEVEEALSRLGMKEFQGFSLKSLFWALAGEPMGATLTSGAGRELMAKASSVSQANGVWHLEFDGLPFTLDLTPLQVDDLWVHRRAQSHPMRSIQGKAKAPVLVETPYAGLTWSQYAWLAGEEK